MDLITLAAFVAVLALIYTLGMRLIDRPNLRAEFEKALSAAPGADPPPFPFGGKEKRFKSRKPGGRARYRHSRPMPMHTKEQLSAVSSASFQKQRVMNSSEFDAFKIIEEEVLSAHKGYRVFAQVNLGEIMQSVNDDSGKSAFRSINSKRVDMLIADPDGWPVLAIEYQGTGHYQGNAAERDAVKKKALTKASVGYLEIFPSDSPSDIRARVREHLGWDHQPIPDVPETVAEAEPRPYFGRARSTSAIRE